MKAPVFFLGFNRPEFTEKILTRIYNAYPPLVYISIDYENSREHSETLKVCSAFNRQYSSKTIFTYSLFNRGCKNSSELGIYTLLKYSDRMIMIEDDTLPLPEFFGWCDAMLEEYKDNKSIWQVSGNNMHSIPFKQRYGLSKFACCWGWGTWADRWQKKKSIFKVDKVLPFYLQHGLEKRLRIDTWDYEWFYTILANKGYCITPKYNMVDNISDSGIHVKRKWHVPNIRAIESNEVLIPEINKLENLYYFSSQWKQKIYNILA